MHAATCLSARVSTNKEVASAALFLATAVCWCSSKFFCTYVGQKPEVPRSFFLFPSVCWGVVGLVTFCGCWDERPLFCHRTSCLLDVALSSGCGYSMQAHPETMLEVRLLPGLYLFWGLGVFWGGFVVLRWLTF